ncbi:MAG: DUF3021 family protein [Firmicutes bacterium]|nr:DUF3021 family protein [Bacillota bacterium]
MISFTISAFCGLLINLLIDVIVNLNGVKGFVSMSYLYVKIFPTEAMAAYVNILIYGMIGFVFAAMTFIYDMERLGFLFQSILYFVVTGGFSVAVTVFLWQLHHYPSAFIGTLTGYLMTHIIIFIVEYRTLRKDVKEINTLYIADAEKN